MASIIKIAILVSLFGIIFVSGLPYHGGANGLAQRQSPNRKHTHFSYHRYHPNTGDLGKRDASGHGKCRPKSQVSTPEKVSTIKHAATASNEAIVNVASTVHTAKKSQETHKSAPPTSSNPSNSTNANGQGSYSGDGTFYATGLDACGWIDKDTAHICAVSHILFDTYPGATANPNHNPICGKMIRATYNGKSVTVKVSDRCTGCAERDLDFSPSAFKQLEPDLGVGRIHNVDWQWL